MEEKEIKDAGRTNKHGVKIISEVSPVQEILDEFKKNFNEKGQYNLPLYRRR